MKVNPLLEASKFRAHQTYDNCTYNVQIFTKYIYMNR